MTRREQEERASSVRSLYRQGETVARIARLNDMSERQVYRVTSQLPGRVTFRTTDADRAQIIALGRSGLSVRAIQRKLGGKDAHIRRLLVEGGIPIGKPGRRPCR